MALKTADFLTALGNINEKYVQQLLEEDAASAGSAVSAEAAGTAGASASAGTVTVRMTASPGENAQPPHAAGERKPGAEHPVSGIFRYIVLAASAAACIGVISMFMMMNRRNPDDLVKESVPAEVTEITAATETTAAETDLTVPTGTAPVTETAVLTEEQRAADETTASAVSASETASADSAEQTTTETTSLAQQAQITQTVPETSAVQNSAAQSTPAETTTTVTADEPDEYWLYEPPLSPAKNTLRVNCLDMATGQPVAGVRLLLIEAPDSVRRTVESWVTDSTGSHTMEWFTDPYNPPTEPYVVRIDALPEGYIGGNDQNVYPGTYSDYEQEINLYFISDDLPKNITATVIDAEEDAVVENAAHYAIYWIDTENNNQNHLIYPSVLPGETVALPDGIYYAALDRTEAEKNGYMPWRSNGYQTWSPDSFMIDFTVTDGKPDKDLIFNAEKTSFALYGGEAFEATLTEPAEN